MGAEDVSKETYKIKKESDPDDKEEEEMEE